MMTQSQKWQTLLVPGITAVVGAGGKTTVLKKLVEYAGRLGYPRIVTTTTKLYQSQVDRWYPYVGMDMVLGEQHVMRAISEGHVGAWFGSEEGTKVTSILPTTIDAMSELHPNWYIFVEADGAKEKWIKAPKEEEPIVPTKTIQTIGLVNMGILGEALEEEHVHRVELVEQLLGVNRGTLITPSLLAKLILHKNGLFQHALGKKIVFLTGLDDVSDKDLQILLDALSGTFVDVIYMADGYYESCEIRKILYCK